MRAAALHRRVEKVDAVRLAIPELVRRLDALNAVVLERAAQADTVAVFAVRAGRIADPFLLQFTALASQPRSVEEILRGVLEPVASPPQATAGKADPGRGPAELVGDGGTAAEREDHLARPILARWFYGRPREGEIFYSGTKPEGWPYRRILRACSRLLALRDPPAQP